MWWYCLYMQCIRICVRYKDQYMQCVVDKTCDFLICCASIIVYGSIFCICGSFVIMMRWFGYFRTIPIIAGLKRIRMFRTSKSSALRQFKCKHREISEPSHHNDETAYKENTTAYNDGSTAYKEKSNTHNGHSDYHIYLSLHII